MLKVGQPSLTFANAVSARLGIGPAEKMSGSDRVKILHSMHEDGPKLAELTSTELLALRVSDPDVRAVPVVYYEMARLAKVGLERRAQPASAVASPVLRLKVLRSSDSLPVVGAEVIAFTDFANRDGDDAITDVNGVVSLNLGSVSIKLDALVIYGPAGYWGLFSRNVAANDGGQFVIDEIDLSRQDYLAEVYGSRPNTAGTQVTVGVIDTGVDGTHPDLTVNGGGAFVTREQDAGGYGPAQRLGDHGTHVAGIVASHGQTPAGKRGVAPGVTLMSYRVFGNDGAGAANYDIVRAIEQGVKDECDLLNLSIELKQADDAVRDAIEEAFDVGTVCIVAAGNGGRQPVSYPAKWPKSVAVSAAGKIGTFPASSSELIDVMAPFATSNMNVFIARFSNIGPEIDFTGPGVGIVSTVPGGKYAVMSGTSMSCPAVTGAAAALLSQNTAVLQMKRDQARSIAIQGMINAAAQPIGFTKDFEGLGVVQ